MSGFFGIIRHDGVASEDLLHQIASELAPRGPDAVNIWSSPELSTCFSLMRTDPQRQSSAQPVTLDQRYWLIGDIRLDGRPELIAQLSQAGEEIAPQATDEALVLHAWRCWAQASLQRLLGDFSFALWDAHESRLWCARDFIGARPFFHAQFPGGFCFGNTLRCFRSLPQLSRELDDRFVGDFLLTGSSRDHSRSVFRDIRRLPSGHLLTYANACVNTNRFLSLPIEDPLRFSSPQECVESFRSLLIRAVKDRMPEGPLAFYLSGGLDSGAVAAIACELAHNSSHRNTSLKAFTLGWRPLVNDSEPDFAQITAAHLALPQEIIEQGATPLLSADSDPRVALPELDFQFFPAASQREFQRVASHACVAFSGDGGDDILTGQSWPYLTFLWKHRDFRTVASSFGGFLLAHGRLPPLRGGFRSRLSRLKGKEDPWAAYPGWLDPDFERRAGLRQRWQELNKPREYTHPTHPLAYASLHSHYWSSVLEREDASFTGQLLETRTPLLDLRLLTFLLHLPPVPWCIDKFLLRETMKASLPRSIVRRRKTPFLGDTLEAALRTQTLRPFLEKDPPVQFHRYVNWAQWSATFMNSKGSFRAQNLHPLSLFLWLKDIENT